MESTTTTIKTCANCGKESGDELKACTACYMVKYCNRDCQIAHRKQHKKECKKRAAEIRDEKLFADPPPREECPICMITLPLNASEVQFKACCGKSICYGCIYAMAMSEGKDLCAFCRTPPPRSHEEEIKRTKKLMDNGNAEAFYILASYYARGIMGMPQDQQKANELLLKAGKFGCSVGYYNLGRYYADPEGEVDEKKAIHYFELAAMMGDVWARHNLGYMEEQTGNYHRAMKHFIISASAGSKDSLDMVQRAVMQGIVSKDIYEECSHAFNERQKETSDAREKAAQIHNR